MRRRLLLETDNDDATELLAANYDETEVDEMIDDMIHDEDFEYDNRGEITDQMGMAVFDPIMLGLKEINNLAHFSVSSHKPGNGVKQLLSDDLDKYWQ